MTKKLYGALKVQRKQTEPSKVIIYGSLGIPIDGKQRVEVPDRPSYVYVRLRDNQNEVIQAFNNSVAPSYDLPVLVYRDSNRYIIQGVNTQRYQNIYNNSAPYLPAHGASHSFGPGGGADTAWIFSRQIMPLLAYPNTTTGTNVIIYPHFMQTPSMDWKYVGGTGTDNLLANYIPTGTVSGMILVYMDANTGNPGILVNSGTYFPNSLTGTNSLTPYIPKTTSPSQIPLTAIRLDSGTYSIGWDNLYDVRQWLQSFPTTGTSGGGGGGSSGISSLPVFGNGQFVVSGTALRFDNNVTVTASGTQAVISFPVTTYFRVGQPTTLSYPSGLFWRVPDGVYATGSLGIFIQGHALIPGIDYIEQIPTSGTYQYLSTPSTGTYHLAHYGVPCIPQPYISTGTTSPNLLADSNVVLMVDSNGNQLVDSNG